MIQRVKSSVLKHQIFVTSSIQIDWFQQPVEHHHQQDEQAQVNLLNKPTKGWLVVHQHSNIPYPHNRWAMETESMGWPVQPRFANSGANSWETWSSSWKWSPMMNYPKCLTVGSSMAKFGEMMNGNASHRKCCKWICCPKFSVWYFGFTILW